MRVFLYLNKVDRSRRSINGKLIGDTHLKGVAIRLYSRGVNYDKELIVNMVFCKVCGLWIAETATWVNAEPGYCDKCKPASLLKKTINRILKFTCAIFIGRTKKT